MAALFRCQHLGKECQALESDRSTTPLVIRVATARFTMWVRDLGFQFLWFWG